VDFPPIPETPIDSWKTLLDALHDPGVIPKWDQQGGHFRSRMLFRGMSRKDWRLQTSLDRLKSPAPVVEPALLRAFRKYAPRGTFAGDSDWETLAVAQHNGLPTRLLDWCSSPLVAAHFATSERQHIDEDGVIWAVDVIAVRDYAIQRDIGETVRRAMAIVFDVALLQGAYKYLAAFDATHAALGDVCVFFEPPSIDSRIANQTGLLSAMNGPEVSHHTYMEKLEAACPGAVHRFIVAKSAKRQIRDMLDQNAIHERVLFPGLPGLCDWLKRYYGPV